MAEIFVVNERIDPLAIYPRAKSLRQAPLRHRAPPAQLPTLLRGEPRPDTVEVQVAHCVLKTLVAHRATRTQFPCKRQVVRMLREEGAGLAFAGSLLKPFQQTVRSPMPALRSGC